MNYRLADVLAEKSVTVNTTETIDIRIIQPISRFIIRCRATNAAATATLLANPAALLTKIELVDGSDVLFSLSGYEAQALNAYEMGVTPDTEIIDGTGNDQHATFIINFGRKLFDRELALDPTRFRNLQLKITNDWDACDANAVAGYILVKAEIFDERVISPIGFLMSKVIESYTMGAAAAYKYIDLPTDHPFRKLLLRPYLTNVAVNASLSEFKLSEDNDKRIPIDVSVDQYLRYMMSVWPVLAEHFQLILSTTVASVYTIPTYWPMPLMMLSAAGYANYDATYYSAERHSIDANASISGESVGVIFGYVPHHTIEFPFGDQMDLDDWYSLKPEQSLRARIYQQAGGSGAVTALFGQQLRRY